MTTHYFRGTSYPFTTTEIPSTTTTMRTTTTTTTRGKREYIDLVPNVQLEIDIKVLSYSSANNDDYSPTSSPSSSSLYVSSSSSFSAWSRSSYFWIDNGSETARLLLEKGQCSIQGKSIQLSISSIEYLRDSKRRRFSIFPSLNVYRDASMRLNSIVHQSIMNWLDRLY